MHASQRQQHQHCDECSRDDDSVNDGHTPCSRQEFERPYTDSGAIDQEGARLTTEQLLAHTVTEQAPCDIATKCLPHISYAAYVEYVSCILFDFVD